MYWEQFLEMGENGYSTNMHIITMVTVPFQIYVLYLIVKVSPKEIRSYRYFLLTFCLWDMLFAFLFTSVLIPVGTSEGSFGSYLFGLASFLPGRGQIFAVALTFYAGSLVIMSQDYCLIYRLVVILDRQDLRRKMLSKGGKFACIFVQQVAAIVIGCLAYLSAVTPERVYAHLETLNADQKEKGFFIWCDTKYSKVIPWFLSIVLGGFVFAEIVAFVLVYCILHVLGKKSDIFSKKTYAMHRRLMLLLACQTSIPIILIIVPASFEIINYRFLHWNYSDWLIQSMCMLIALYASFNALLTLLFIDVYQTHLLAKIQLIKEIFGCRSGRKNRALSINAITPIPDYSH